MSKVAVIVFPGSNCERDVHHVLEGVLRLDAEYHWYKEPLKQDYAAVLLPGGFAYGDYLRAGALAKMSPAVETLGGYIEKGKPVLGICNGFQILCEAGYLPGALTRNESLHYQCENVYLRVESNRSMMIDRAKKGDVLTMPIAHAEGRYVADKEVLSALEKNDQIAFRYCGPGGEIEDRYNANGSVSSIAGITNKEGNVLGMMPHPDRCAEEILGNIDGLKVFESLKGHL